MRDREVKYLEDFRLNEYLITYLMLLSDRSNPKVNMSYNTYSMHAFYSTNDDIHDLENGKNFINNGRRVLPSISLWYLALESFINCLCKITSFTLASNPEPILQKDIGSRVSYLLKTMKYDEMTVKRTGVYNRINEFRQFRNELFHDRNIGLGIKFEKTDFSSIPILSNQVDIFQSLLIFLEITSLFRYSIPGLDLMPNISVGTDKVLHFDKLDVLFKEYLAIYFQLTLSKHDLKTHLDFEINNYTSLPASEIFSQGEIVVLARHAQEEKYNHQINQETTSIGKDSYLNIVKAYKFPDGHTGNLNFFIDWPEFYKSCYPMRR